jgi:apolipoprotein N-acyltransferase
LFWNTGLYRVLSLALALSLAEWMRGHVLSGFPWNVLGYALTYPVSLMQNAALVGIYGLTLIAILVFAAPAVMWADAAERPAGRRHRMAALAIAIVPLAGMYLFGQLRLALAESAVVPDVKLRIVQPSVPQREKWRPENQERIFIEHLNLSAQAPDGTKDNLSGISHVIWPEAAMPFLPLDYPDVRAAIGRMLGSGKFLLAGALRADPASAGTLRRRVFNSLIVLGEGGSLVALYDKIHLVPFGEYLPVQSALEAIGLQQLTRMRGGFEVGIQPRPLLRVPGLPPAAPLICYEAIFPHAIVGQPGRAGFMLNVTNDGWFGNTTGPRQHFHQARVRTVEEGLPLVRAANNGISAVIDPYGRISARLDLDVHGVIDAALPKPIKPPLYAVWGDGLFFVFCIGCAAILATDRWRNGNLQRMS